MGRYASNGHMASSKNRYTRRPECISATNGVVSFSFDADAGIPST